MEQPDVETEQDKRAGEHETAQAELRRLIDNPEQHIPVIDYIVHLRDARKAVARTHKAMMAAWSA